jgi:transcriptional regulator with XRE-family HTH domain
VPGKSALETLWGQDLLFYAGVVKQTPVITMAPFRSFSAHPNEMISATQCRSARALLGWSVAKLASAASVSASAIDDFEAERRAPVPAVAGPIRRAFEPVGVAFLPGEEIRLRPGAPEGRATGTPSVAAKASRQALIGALPRRASLRT